jgi:hypothetical protein
VSFRLQDNGTNCNPYLRWAQVADAIRRCLLIPLLDLPSQTPSDLAVDFVRLKFPGPCTLHCIYRHMYMDHATNILFCSPEVGPLVGGFINQYTNWRWSFYVLLIWAGVQLALIVFFVPETYHPVLLRQKAVKLRKESKEERWIAPIERMDRSIARTVLWSCIRPFQLLVLEPMVSRFYHVTCFRYDALLSLIAPYNVLMLTIEVP